ncbi:MAG: hypothetical protein WA709_18525 [Stellaceae bacterium]
MRWFYARAVTAALSGGDQEGRQQDNGGKLHPAYRLYKVQNGNHTETYKDTFPQLELIQPHAQRDFRGTVNRRR